MFLSLLLWTQGAAASGCPAHPRQVRYEGKCLDGAALTAAFACPSGTHIVVDDNPLFWSRTCNDNAGRLRLEQLWVVTEDSVGLPLRIIERDSEGSGVYTHFHANSTAAQHIIPQANFENHGVAKVFYANGALAEEGPWAAGKLHGLWKTYDEDGAHTVESCTVLGQRMWDNHDSATFGQRECAASDIATTVASFPRPDLVWARKPTTLGRASDLIATADGVVIVGEHSADDKVPVLHLASDPERYDWGPDGAERLGRVVLSDHAVVAEWTTQRELRVREASTSTKRPKAKASTEAWRTVATGISRAKMLLSDGKQIWCIATDDEADEYVERVYRFTWDGERTVLATAAGLVAGTSADAEFLYWGDDEGIKRVSRDGGDVTVLAPSVAFLSELVVTGEWLYFGSGGHQNYRGHVGDGGIYKMPRTGGTPELVVSWGDVADDLVVDDGWLYWGAFEEIARMPLDGSMMPILMTTDVTFPVNLTLHDGRLWFTDEDGAVGHIDARARHVFESRE